MQPRHPLAIAPYSFVWIAIGLAACAATGPPPPTAAEREQAQAQYEGVQEVLAVDAGTGTAELERFLRDWPDSQLADDAALELARRSAANQQYDRAARHLVWAARSHPRGDRIDEIQLLLSEVERSRGNTEAAYRTAARIRLSRLAPEDRHRVHLLLADLAGERGDHVLALRWWARAHASAPDQEERGRLESAIDGVLADRSRQELETAARKLDGRFPTLRIELRLVELALDAEDPERAREHLAAASKLSATTAENERRLELEQRLSATDLSGSSAAELPGFSDVKGVPDLRGARGTIGVVLPLSGAFSGFGEECLRGVLMAAGVFGGDGNAGVRVVVRDSGGTPEGASAAVEQLASDSSVSAIVGPLLASEAEGAAATADARRIPLLALTGRDNVASTRPHVFRVGREPRGEIQVLVHHAVQKAGLGRFAILYPDDAYGRGARDLFWDEVEAQGGRVVGVESYEPDDTDFAKPIRRLVGFSFLTEAQKEALEVREEMLDQAKRLPPAEALVLREEARAMLGPEGEPLPPTVGFDALFIPDSYEQVTLIAPQLAFHEVSGVRLLGSAGWNHPDLVRIGRHHLNGAIFTETFYPDSEVPYVAAFTRGFEGAYGAVPGSLAALSFDATNLVMAQLARGLRDRDRLREALLDVRAYPGVSGITNMRSDGTAQKRPYLLGVTRRRIVALDE